MRLAGSKGSRKAWIEFGTKESARSAREYDNTVSSLFEIGRQGCMSQLIIICKVAATWVENCIALLHACLWCTAYVLQVCSAVMYPLLLALQVLSAATVRVRPSKTAIHTNGLQREQDSNSGSKTPSPSRTGDTNSPGGSHSQMLASSRQIDRHPEVAQQPAQLRNHGQATTSGSPPLSQQGQPPQQQAMQMVPSTSDIQQHLMANMPPAMMHQQPQQQYTTNGSGYAGAMGSMPMSHAQQLPHALQQPSGYQQLPVRSSASVPRSSNQNYAPAMSPNNSGRTSPGLKRAYDDVQQSNASAAAAAAAFLSKQQQQQQQADDKRMRMSH